MVISCGMVTCMVDAAQLFWHIDHVDLVARELWQPEIGRGDIRHEYTLAGTTRYRHCNSAIALWLQQPHNLVVPYCTIESGTRLMHVWVNHTFFFRTPSVEILCLMLGQMSRGMCHIGRIKLTRVSIFANFRQSRTKVRDTPIRAKARRVRELTRVNRVLSVAEETE